MASISYNKLFKNEFDNIVSKRDKLQDLNINQQKLGVNDTYEKDEKITTSFEPTDDSYVLNKAYLYQKLKKIDGHISYIENDYNEFKSQNNKQFVEEVLVQRAVNTTIQILYDKGSFVNYANADKVSEDFFSPQDVGVIYQSKKMMSLNDLKILKQRHNLKKKQHQI